MELTDEQLIKLHNHLLNLLKVFDSFCKKNNLKYYLLGGSALGAMRHGGFIPWDDDIDIGMPRKDFDRLLSIFPQNGIGNVVLRTNDRNRIDHVYPWAKIEDSATSLIVEWHKHLNPKTGVFMDLFPLDGAPDSFIHRKKHILQIQKLRYYLARSYKKDWSENMIKNLVLMMIRNNLGRKLIVKLNDFLLKKYSYDNSKYVGNPMGEWGVKEVMKKEIYGNPRKIIFEDMISFVPERTDEYLTNLYGINWNVLPPLNKRKSDHHWSKLSF